MPNLRPPLLLSLLLLAGCVQGTEPCGPAWNPSESAWIDLQPLKERPVPQVEISLFAEVHRCYRPKQPNQILVFGDERRDQAGNRYLVFDIKDVSDLAFVAVVDRQGKIVKADYAGTNY